MKTICVLCVLLVVIISCSATVIKKATVVPTSLVISASDSVRNAMLVWNDNTEPDLEGYRVYQKQSKFASYQLIDDTGLSTTLPISEPGIYAVTAYDTAGNESNYSESLIWQMQSPDSNFFFGRELIPMNQSGFGQTGDTLIIWGMGAGDTVWATLPVDLESGQFEISTNAYAYQWRGNVPPEIAFVEGTSSILVSEVFELDSIPDIYSSTVTGPGRFGIAFLNDDWGPEPTDPDINVGIVSVEYSALQDTSTVKPFWPRNIKINGISAFGDTVVVILPDDSLIVEADIPAFLDDNDSTSVELNEIEFNIWHRLIGEQWQQVFANHIRLDSWQQNRHEKIQVTTDDVREFTVTSFYRGEESVTPQPILVWFQGDTLFPPPGPKKIETIEINLRPKTE